MGLIVKNEAVNARPSPIKAPTLRQMRANGQLLLSEALLLSELDRVEFLTWINLSSEIMLRGKVEQREQFALEGKARLA